MIQYLREGVFLHTGTQEHFDSLVRSGRWAAIPDHQIPYGVALEMADRLDAIAKKPKRQSTGTNERGQNCWEPNEPCGRACRPKGTCKEKLPAEPKKPRVTKADVAKKIAEKKAISATEKTPTPKKQSLRDLMKEHGIKRKDYDAARAKAVDDAIATLEKKAKSGAMSQDESQSQIAKIRKASSTALTKTFGAKAVESILASRKNAPPQPEPTPKKPRKTKAKAKVPDPTPTPDPVPPKKAEKPVAPKPVAPKPDPKPGPKPDPEPENSKTSSVTPTLKAKSFNPHAQPDLSPRDFRKAWDAMKKLEDIDKNPPLSFEQWSRGSQKPSKPKYQAYLATQTQMGMPVSEDLYSGAGIKVSNQVKKEIAANQKKMAQLRDDAATIQKAIEYPLLSEDEARGFKHRMTPEEANAYTAGSFTGDMKFYHGNGKGVIESMEKNGIQPDLNSRGIYGRGAYFGSNESIGKEYQLAAAWESGGSGLVEIQAKVKNPFVMETGDFSDLSSRLGLFAGESGDGKSPDSEAVQSYMRAMGYDSIYLKNVGYFVTFDSKQTVITNLTYTDLKSPEWKQLKEEIYDLYDERQKRIMEGTFSEAEEQEISRYATSRKLAQLSKSSIPNGPDYDSDDDDLF